MNSEETVETVSDTTGVVAFTIAAGAAYYSALGIVFDDTDTFKNQVTTLSSTELFREAATTKPAP